MLENYQQTILQAFREVADLLASLSARAEQLARQREQLSAAQEAVRLADVRYRKGLVTYLDVLNAQLTVLVAETQLILTERTRLTDMVGLFKALGGGWARHPTETLPETLLIHAARNVKCLAMNSARYYADSIGNYTMSGQQNSVPQSLPPTILVVDDEPSITKLCKAILHQAGFSVLNAEGSSEALRVCTQHNGPIDLLLTDLVLPPPGFQLASSANQFPHVHGHELAVRALRIRKNLRVIIMSGKIDQDLAGYGLHRGSLLFLSKPFEPRALVALVQQALQASPPSAESLTEGLPKVPRVGDEWFD